MEKIIFDKDKIKISRISIYDSSVCGVGFEQEGKKYFPTDETIICYNPDNI